ncbi:hypothetical protein WN944_007327 [Citrus x changshan-huyou]|uniref:CCHC-type domain-containing protein n=1 Tax=Citrus x changshan-huyou TaxID=2935761 RepID=A0AAP0MMQ9_9ROSI
MNDDQQGINKNYKVPELDVPSSYDIPSTAQAGIQSVYKQSLMPLESQSKDVLNNFRYGSLNAEFNEISFYASKSDAAYWKLKSHLAQLKSEIKELRTCDNGDTDRPCSAEKKARIVKDPLVVKTKGAPSTKFNKGVNTRKCGYCKQDGHTARKCPNYILRRLPHLRQCTQNYPKIICICLRVWIWTSYLHFKKTQF